MYQLKVTLLDTKPPVWRRVLVDGDATLDHLHEVIQAAFGWWNYHLHEFEIGRRRYGVPDPDRQPAQRVMRRLGTCQRRQCRIRFLHLVAEPACLLDSSAIAARRGDGQPAGGEHDTRRPYCV